MSRRGAGSVWTGSVRQAAAYLDYARPPSRCTPRRARPCWRPSTGGTPTRAGCTAPARDARLLLDNARAVVAEASACAPTRSTFTSSGTDAVHRGLLGPGRGPAPTVAHAAVEHSAVLHALAWRPDLRRAPVPVDRLGRVDLGRPRRTPDVRRRCSAPTTRSAPLQPVAEVGRRARRARSSWTPAPRWAGSRCPTAGRRARGLGAQVGRPGRASACCWCARAPAGATRSPATTGSTSGRPASRTSRPPSAAAAALQAVVAERDEVNARQHALVDRIRARGRRRSPTSRWSATRSTGSPTW